MRFGARCRQRALDTYRQLGDRGNEGIALHGIGEVHLRRGHYERTAAILRHALAIFLDVGDQPRQILVHHTLGEALRSAGHLDDARAHHTTALHHATAIGDRYEQARARALAGLGDQKQAHHLYTDLGVPQP
jgi:tetratricopeptide (TPR) repeat protein